MSPRHPDSVGLGEGSRVCVVCSSCIPMCVSVCALTCELQPALIRMCKLIMARCVVCTSTFSSDENTILFCAFPFVFALLRYSAELFRYRSLSTILAFAHSFALSSLSHHHVATSSRRDFISLLARHITRARHATLSRGLVAIVAWPCW